MRYSAGFSSTASGGGTADGSTVGTTFPISVVGGSGTQQLKVNEVMVGGEASSTSAPQILRFGHDSTLSTTPAAGAALIAAMDATASVQTSPPNAYGSAATGPVRSATTGRLLALSFNAYGGIARWQARVGEEITTIGNTAPLGSLTLSAFTGNTTANLSGHVILEAT